VRNVAARNIKVSRENTMMKPTGTAAILFAAASAWLISGGALAQSSTAEPHANAPNTARPEAGGQGGGAEDRPEVVAPVLRIISVEVLRSSHGTPLDIIRVRGLASTPGWEEAELIPLTRGTPKDGILELVFVARAPAEAMEASGFEPIEAIFPIEASHPYKGINVHSASESVSLSQLPGYAEGKGGGEDCSKCVGKVFVAKGAAMPAGKSAAEVVKEEQLPTVSRVIRHSDGIPSAESNPNRLTIVVSKDGTIATAIWD
jgi:hypothetical protein